jgi:glycosyltransferase involved in cell wall biosynthesis
MITLHDGFAAQQFEKLPSLQSVRRTLKLPLNKRIAMYAGSLYPDREITTILDLAGDFQEVFFVIVGGPDKTADKIRKIASERNLANIYLTGYIPQEEIPGYLAAADILLALWSRKVITINYCSPMKLFEYMASGKLIVAHGFPTIHEVLTDKSDSLLVNPDSYHDLNTTFQIALDNPDHTALGEKARNLAFEKYTWEKRVDAILTRIKDS